MPLSKNGPKASYFSALFLYVTVGLLIGLFVLSWTLKIPLLSLLYQISESYFFKNLNTVKVGNLSGFNFHMYIYKGIILFTGLALIKEIFVSYLNETPFSLKKHSLLLPHITFIVLLWLVVLQTFNRTQIFINEFEIFAGKSLEEKQSFINSWTYDFGYYSQNIVSGRHHCAFQTDKNLNLDPFMFRQRQLGYFLYPTFDIRGVWPDRPTDCLVVWQKNAIENVPEDFEIKAVFDSERLLAIKKSK